MFLMDMFDDWMRFPRKPKGAKLVEKTEEVNEETGEKIITEIWLHDNIRFTSTVYESGVSEPELKGEELIKQLENKLQEAIEQQNFEDAAIFRDKLIELKKN